MRSQAHARGMFGDAELILILFVGLLFVVSLGSWIVGIAAGIHALVREDIQGTQQLVWALLSFFVPVVGIVYFVLGKERTRAAFAGVGEPAAPPYRPQP